jgi:F0F1-type ATP synthase membrane subunit c/vacuolar-type H+-ATPase subunit K
MDCPKCHQTTSVGSGSVVCPLCGFEIEPLQQRLRTVYAISFALFASVAIYGGLVWFLEQQSGFRGSARALPPALPYVFLALGVVVFGIVIQVLRRRVPTAPSMAALQTLMVIRLALAESIAIYGFVLYLVGRSVEWFVILLGLSFLTFLFIAASMPQVARRMAELALGEEANGRLTP